MQTVSIVGHTDDDQLSKLTKSKIRADKHSRTEEDYIEMRLKRTLSHFSFCLKTSDVLELDI